MVIRRWSTLVVVCCVVAVACLVSVLVGASGKGRRVDVSTPSAQASIAPTAVVDVLRSTAERELGSELDSRGGRTAPVASDASTLATGVDAPTLSVLFGKEGDRTWKIFAAGSGDAPGGGSCEAAPKGFVVSCREVAAPAGDRTIVTTMVAVAAPEKLYGPGKYVIPEAGSFDEARLATARVQLRATTYHRNGSSVSATETVFGPASATLSKAFSSTEEELVAVVQDPAVTAAVGGLARR